MIYVSLWWPEGMKWIFSVWSFPILNDFSLDAPNLCRMMHNWYHGVCLSFSRGNWMPRLEAKPGVLDQWIVISSLWQIRKTFSEVFLRRLPSYENSSLRRQKLMRLVSFDVMTLDLFVSFINIYTLNQLVDGTQHFHHRNIFLLCSLIQLGTVQKHWCASQAKQCSEREVKSLFRFFFQKK
jgi:hypothetical protein